MPASRNTDKHWLNHTLGYYENLCSSMYTTMKTLLRCTVKLKKS